ncbi:hypothetical protein ACWGE0_31030 [Lentzea sp. NPDC054927]
MLPALLTPGWVPRLLSARPMVWLGERSYSIYLVQSIAHSVVLLSGASGLVMALSTSIVAIGIADLRKLWTGTPGASCTTGTPVTCTAGAAGGRRGTALGVSENETTEQIVINRSTGEYLLSPGLVTDRWRVRSELT